ncbi:hypothetical protein MMC19_006530 [Ptychographa xylographoides]|nr:hypothetical protein [Ptychographa xylographoides]
MANPNVQSENAQIYGQDFAITNSPSSVYTDDSCTSQVDLAAVPVPLFQAVDSSPTAAITPFPSSLEKLPPPSELATVKGKHSQQSLELEQSTAPALISTNSAIPPSLRSDYGANCAYLTTSDGRLSPVLESTIERQSSHRTTESGPSATFNLDLSYQGTSPIRQSNLTDTFTSSEDLKRLSPPSFDSTITDDPFLHITNSSHTATFTSYRDPKPTSVQSIEFVTLIETWQEAVDLYNNLKVKESLKLHRRLLRDITEETSINYVFHSLAPPLWFNLGIIKSALGDPLDAAGAFQECIKLDPTFLLARYALGIAYFKLRHFKLSEEAFHDVLSAMVSPTRIVEQEVAWNAELNDFSFFMRNARNGRTSSSTPSTPNSPRGSGLLQRARSFILERRHVEWNARAARNERGKPKKQGQQHELDTTILNDIPEDALFTPPPLTPERLLAPLPPSPPLAHRDLSPTSPPFPALSSTSPTTPTTTIILRGARTTPLPATPTQRRARRTETVLPHHQPGEWQPHVPMRSVTGEVMEWYFRVEMDEDENENENENEGEGEGEMYGMEESGGMVLARTFGDRPM